MTELLKPGLAGAGAGSGEYESDRAGAYQAHAGRTWIGAGPLRTGAGQDDSDSDGAGARHTADRGAGSRTHDRAVIQGSSWAGAGAGSGEYESDRAGAYQAHMLDRPVSETGP